MAALDAETLILKKRGNAMEQISQTQEPHFLNRIFAQINSAYDRLLKIGARKIIIALFPFLILVAAGIILLNLKHVTIMANGRTAQVSTFSTDAYAILNKEGIKVSQYDKVEFSGFVKNRGTIKVIPAFKVSVTADKKTSSAMVTDGTVSDILKKLNVTVGKDDIVSSPLDSKVFANQTITVSRVTYKTETKSSPISFKTEKIPTVNFRRGVERVLNEGRQGITTTTTKIKYIDGVATNQVTVSKKVSVQPIFRKLLVGTAASTPVSTLTAPSNLKLDANGVPTKYSRCLTGKATAYTASSKCRTVTGRHVGVGYVAVNPKLIPYGSRLYIMTPDGSFVYGYAKAADTGDFVSNGSGVLTDLYFDSNAQCRRFGSRTVNIYVLD
jgi:uncharacterized protein YabE (DUF348 family)/3D (Asp-Asp-Asp) domain-containing protein